MDLDVGDAIEDEWQPVFLTVRPGLRPLGGGGGPSGFPPEVRLWGWRDEWIGGVEPLTTQPPVRLAAGLDTGPIH